MRPFIITAVPAEASELPAGTVYDLLRVTKLDRVFDIEKDEAAALKSAHAPGLARSGS